MTRDSIYWWFGILGGLAMAFAAHKDLFPWFPEHVNKAIEIVAFVTAVVSGKMATSPLPSKEEERFR